MPDAKEILEKSFDILLSEAVAFAENRSIQSADEEITLSEHHKKQMRKLFSATRKKRKLQIRKPDSQKITYSAGILFVVLAISCSYPFLRKPVLHPFYNSTKPNLKNTVSGNETYYSDDNIYIGYVPAGFEKTIDKRHSKSTLLRFECQEKYFGVTVNALSVKTLIDTENAIIEYLTIHGNKAIFSGKDIANIIVWHTDTYAFRVTGNLEKDVLIRIAESVTFKK